MSTIILKPTILQGILAGMLRGDTVSPSSFLSEIGTVRRSISRKYGSCEFPISGGTVGSSRGHSYHLCIGMFILYKNGYMMIYGCGGFSRKRGTQKMVGVIAYIAYERMKTAGTPLAWEPLETPPITPWNLGRDDGAGDAAVIGRHGGPVPTFEVRGPRGGDHLQAPGGAAMPKMGAEMLIFSVGKWWLGAEMSKKNGLIKKNEIN